MASPPLEPTLSEIVAQHRKTSQQLRNDLEKEKQDFVKSVEELGRSLLDKLDKGVGKTYENQRRLEAEAKNLEGKAVTFANEINQWTTLYSSFNDALKELGDVKNWAQGIEADLNSINTSLTQVVSKARASSSGASAADKDAAT
uniref:Biogenesis of lysosome-related organelles complex 1 subunit 1 n=1 Tax=Lotharella globosa TaxID=91324 RepID=A0A7S3Z9Z0_9EUKA